MKQPWLIQRCELEDGRLRYDYMGSTEFEIGDQAKALKRIFAEGLCWSTTIVRVQGREVMVHMIAANSFPFEEYQQYLQQLVEDKLHLKEWTGFGDLVKVGAGIHSARSYTPETNVWFDFQNDVLWTLSKNKRKSLVSVLNAIKSAWAEKA